MKLYANIKIFHWEKLQYLSEIIEVQIDNWFGWHDFYLYCMTKKEQQAMIIIELEGNIVLVP